ncbi:MAG: Na+/H+ antiporter NhaA [Pirellulaceae bacterium]|nr:Na+/H+ antiporter NhaA [Pirellulaceae bacterium]
MSHSSPSRIPRPIAFLFENSLFLVAGAVAALLWANLSPDSYHRFVHFDLGHHVLGMPAVEHAEHGEEHGAGQGAEHGNGHAEELDAGHEDEPGAESAAPAASPAVSPAAQGDGESHGATAGSPSERSLLQILYNAVSGSHGLTVHFVINDFLMALFFAIAGKEVWESLLPGGALANPRKAATPLMATLGGVVGPALIYLAGAAALGQMATLGRGWAIPCATDIAFSYLVARLVFGNGHPAIAFLLLLAIADDAAGLVILAVFYPQEPLQPAWFLLTLLAIGLTIGFKKLRLHSFWWYLLIPGIISWLSFKMAGVHAALGLVPIIPFIPHAHTDLGIFAREELNRTDTLNEFEHWWKNPVELILGLFGLANAGVVFSSVGAGTWLVLGGLLLGKPIGITLLTWISEKLLGLEVPAGMRYKHVISLGMIAAIGFTVALFVSTAAFPQTGPVQDSVKMGALASFLAAPIAIVLARLLGVRPGTQ